MFKLNTVPLAPLTQTSLYLDNEKLDPVRQGSALLKERVGTLNLQASNYGAMTPLCDIEVRPTSNSQLCKGVKILSC